MTDPGERERPPSPYHDNTKAAVKDDSITIRPRVTDNTVKLRVNKNGKGYVTSYTVSIGCAEAAEAGFLGEDRMPLPLEKIIDPQRHTITFALKA